MKEDTIKASIEKGDIFIHTARLPAGAVLIHQPIQNVKLRVIPFRIDKESGEMIKEEPEDVSYPNPLKIKNEYVGAIIVGFIGLKYDEQKPTIEKLKSLFSKENIQTINALIELISKLKGLLGA